MRESSSRDDCNHYTIDNPSFKAQIWMILQKTHNIFIHFSQYALLRRTACGFPHAELE